MPRCVPNQLLHGQPTRALHKAAFNLPDVQGWVQGRPTIVKNIAAQDTVFARERVNHDLCDRSAIGEIQKRPARAFDAIPSNVGRFVKSRGRERNPRLIG